MSKKVRITGLVVGLILLAGAIVAPLAFRASGSSGSGPIGKVPASVRNLIANPPSYDCVTAAKKYKLPTQKGKVVLTYIPNAVGSAVNQRDDTDSVNISALPANRDRINASICTQPEEAGMIGVALVLHQPELAQINSKLFAQFKNVTVKEWADKVFSGRISYAKATKTMSQLAGFMTIFSAKTENSLSTAWNYHAEEATSTKANVRPIVVNSKQYTGDFVVYDLTMKGLNGCWVAPFGINVGVGGNVSLGDQRIAGFTCTPPSPTPTPTPPGHTPPPHHTTPPVVCTLPGEHLNSSGNCSKGSLNATPPPGAYVDPGDPLETGTSAGAGSSGSADTSGATGSNGKTGTQDQGGQTSGVNTSSTNSGTTDPNESSNNGGTSTGDTGAANTNPTPVAGF